ncbi:MAG TPA: hypothetical protein VIV11_24755 [Kofleriaceae bacterium]
MMRESRLLIALVLAACGGTAPPAPEPSARPARSAVATPDAPRCEPPPANASSPKGELVYTHGYSELQLYRVDAAGCAKLVATIDTGDPFAFASVGEAQPGSMPEISVDTWLMHGDRKRRHFVWRSGHYFETGRVEEIRGPRRR